VGAIREELQRNFRQTSSWKSRTYLSSLHLPISALVLINFTTIAVTNMSGATKSMFCHGSPDLSHLLTKPTAPTVPKPMYKYSNSLIHLSPRIPVRYRSPCDQPITCNTEYNYAVRDQKGQHVPLRDAFSSCQKCKCKDERRHNGDKQGPKKCTRRSCLRCETLEPVYSK
jgi:hypothetical protein